LFTDSGVATQSSVVSGQITSFIRFVNTRLVPESVDPAALTIPEDPEGKVTLRRFRRTLAWFIRHRPDGDVTAAIQYDHLNTVISGMYGGTMESGLQSLMAEEDWAHRRSTIDSLSELLSAGQGISGPAAHRAIAAVQAMPRDLTPGDERRLKKNRALVVYDNPSAVALCVYSEATALCQRPMRADAPAAPDLLGCVDGCPNCGRTDEHLRKLREQASELRQQASLSPQPLAQSMLAEAQRRETLYRDFRKTRVVIGKRPDDPTTSQALM
jgi:hypothetical protein